MICLTDSLQPKKTKEKKIIFKSVHARSQICINAICVTDRRKETDPSITGHIEPS